jgi:2-polyprenyl-3-methyl-5-hydroxy-6-metoxy-1,4-benzoquinol methylase
LKTAHGMPSWTCRNISKTEIRDAKRSAIAVDARPRSRPLRERTRYEPNLPQEEFIVRCCVARSSPISRTTPLSKETAKAVDIWCGGQPFRELLQQIGYSYCGVDLNPGPPVDVLWAADEPLPEELLRRGAFDFLLCTEVIEHVADWHTAFANFGLLLVPSGRVLIAAPYFYQLLEEPYDFWRPTMHTIDYYARRTGRDFTRCSAKRPETCGMSSVDVGHL